MTIPSVNKHYFTSSFPICIPFISFTCVITLARTSSIMLKRNGERGDPCLVRNFLKLELEKETGSLYGDIKLSNFVSHCTEVKKCYSGVINI